MFVLRCGKRAYESFLDRLETLRLERFKRRILAILEKAERNAHLFLQKSILGVGHISVYKDGSMWKKTQQNPPKWKCIKQAKVYSEERKGTKISIGKLKSKVQECNSFNELYELTMANIERFRDNKGQMLPIVQELKNVIDERQEQLQDVITNKKRFKIAFEPRINENGVIVESATEKKLENNQLKRKVFEFAKNKLQGGYIKNISTGKKIFISSNGLGEWQSKSKSREQILSIKILDFLLRNAKKIGSSPDKTNNPSFNDCEYYECFCKINGKPFKAIMTIKNPKTSDSKYYHHYLQDIKIEPSSTLMHPSKKSW